jgi:hypothetical protein
VTTLALLTTGDLEALWEILKVIAPDDPTPVFGVAFWIDPQDGGLKVKVNNTVWSRALGTTIERL